MKDERTSRTNVDSRPAYEPPRALRLGDMHVGNGIARCGPGSGDVQSCSMNGNSAVSDCNANGNNAGALCDSTGSGVVAVS